MSVLRAYTRSPGLLIRFSPDTTGTLPVDVLQGQVEDDCRTVLLLADVGDEALVLEDAGRSRAWSATRARRTSVCAPPREAFRTRGQPCRRWDRRCSSGSYQLDFVTPGSSPRRARLAESRCGHRGETAACRRASGPATRSSVNRRGTLNFGSRLRLGE